MITVKLKLAIRICVLSAIVFSHCYSSSQNLGSNPTQKKAASFFQKGQYKECFDLYKTLEIENNLLYARARGEMAACCVQLGYPADSAFHYLIGDEKYPVQSFWLAFPEFEKIENDNRWNTFLNLIKKRYTKTNDTLGVGYQLLLTTITDQRNRQKLSKRNAYPDLDKNEIWKIIERDDSINLSILINIVEKHGWPTISKFGSMPCGSAFFILQHANLSIQEKYLPIIDSLASINELSQWDFVYLADRVMVQKIGLQLYGTQYDDKGLVPIFEPENLNIRCKKAKISLWTDEELIHNGIDPKIVKK